MKKSIWFISKYASPPQSLGGQRGVSLASEFVKAGHVAAVISSFSNHFGVFREEDWLPSKNGFKKARFNGVTMLAHETIRYRRINSIRRALSWLHFEWGLVRLPTQLLDKPTHIIVSSLSLFSILSGSMLARRFGARVIFEVRDIWPLTLMTEMRFSDSNPVVKIMAAIEKFGYVKSDLVVGTMPNLKEHVRSVTGLDTRVETVPLGLDNDLPRFLPKYIPPPNDIQPTIVGYFGSIGRTNSIDVLLSAAEEIGPGQNLEFHFWGGGDLLDRYRKLFSNRDFIHFHGRVARDKLFSEVSRANLLYLATDTSILWKYGQSLNKLLEYMFLGRPILASYSGFPSMLNEANSGVFVPAGDAKELAKAILSYRALPPKRLEEIGRQGRDWIESERSYAHLAGRYLNLLDSL